MKQIIKFIIGIAAIVGVAIALAPQASAAGLSNYFNNKVLDYIYRGQTFTAPTTLCVALTTTTPTAASTGATIAEAAYTGYARGQLNPSASNWSGTGSETSGASAGTTGTVKNNVAITVGSAPSSGPTTVTSFAVLDSCTVGTGNVLAFAALTTSKTINSGDSAPVFTVNALTVHLQ
jgi:hypothetical protein